MAGSGPNASTRADWTAKCNVSDINHFEIFLYHRNGAAGTLFKSDKWDTVGWDHEDVSAELSHLLTCCLGTITGGVSAAHSELERTVA
jgi:hypothetical protein